MELTARVNAALGSNYKVDELKQMPSDELVRISVWLSAHAAKTIGEDV